MSRLKLKRASEFANWLRAYHVVLDGERVGKIRNGKEIEVAIAPGSHTVELAIDWCRSNPLDVEVHDRDDLVLRCGSNYAGLRTFRGVARMVTDHQHYLWLRPAITHNPQPRKSRETMTDVMPAWNSYEQYYRRVKTDVAGFSSAASLVGTQMILDVPTRLEYMRMIRAEADDMLAHARANRRTAQTVFDRIFKRRNELRLIAQDRARASVTILSKLLTKDRSKYQILVSAANTLAREGKLPVARGSTPNNVRSIPLEELTPDQLDDVFLKAIDKAGGSRKTITPARMRGNGGALLLLTVALAGLDIYLSQDKSFAVSKNISSVAGGAGGAWALAAAGLAVGGPVGGVIGLIVGGVVGSYAAEEAHFHVRGLHSTPEIDRLVRKYHGIVNFDEDGLARAMHTEFLADLTTVLTTFVHLNEKRSGDADDVARTWVAEAKRVVERYPEGALDQGFAHPIGQNLLAYLHSTLDAGWTSGTEYKLMAWMKSKMTTSR